MDEVPSMLARVKEIHSSPYGLHSRITHAHYIFASNPNGTDAIVLVATSR